MNRKDKVKELRPHISSKEFKNISDEEQFQNQVIRPILKFQNELFIKLFLSNCKAYKINLTESNSKEKKDFISQIFKKDIKLRTVFIGTIIALFTEKELEKYLVNRQLYNKRIILMLTERLKNQLS